MCSRAKAQVKGFSVAKQYPAGCAHGTGYDNRLADIPVPARDLLHACRKSSGSAFSVDNNLSGAFAVNAVALHLGYIMRNIIYKFHIQVLLALPEDPLKGLSCPVSYHLPVGPCKIQRSIHCLAVILPFL